MDVNPCDNHDQHEPHWWFTPKGYRRWCDGITREQFLQALSDLYGTPMETLKEIDNNAGKPTPGGNVWPNGLD